MSPPADIATLLAAWHSWRSAYTPERRHAKARLLCHASEADEEDFEALRLRALDDFIERLPPGVQLALQHVARAQALGVEVMASPRLPANHEQRERMCTEAVGLLRRRLLALDLL